MKKYLNLENIVLIASFIISLIIAILYSSLSVWIIFFSSIFGIISSFFSSQGKWLGFVFDIISYAIYIYTCLTQLYYGEMILSVVIIVLHVLSLVQWKKHEENGVVVVDDLSKKMLISSLIISIIGVVGYTAVLWFINSEYPILNGLATVVYLLKCFYSYKRSVWQFGCYLVYEIIFIILWLLALENGEMGGYIFLVGGISELIFCVFGLINFNKLKIKQNLKK